MMEMEMEILDLAEKGGTPPLEIEFAIASLRARGGQILKILHGKKIRKQEARKCLRNLHRGGKIAFFVPGERFGNEDTDSRYLVNKYPAMSKDADFGKENEEMVIVCL